MEVIRTYLELQGPERFRPAFGEFRDIRIERVDQASADLYRHLYRTAGEAYHWRDRWDWSDSEIGAHLAQPEIMLHVAKRGSVIAGWYELRRVPDDRSVEIAYFGLMPGELGRGLGKHLLSWAVRDAWALAPSRVWLHTCTLDHPAALPNYVKRGFVPYRTEIYETEASRRGVE